MLDSRNRIDEATVFCENGLFYSQMDYKESLVYTELYLTTRYIDLTKTDFFFFLVHVYIYQILIRKVLWGNTIKNMSSYMSILPT